MTVHRGHSVLILMALTLSAPALAQRVVSEYAGVMDVDGRSLFVELRLEREPLVEWREGIPHHIGWRVTGSLEDTLHFNRWTDTVFNKLFYSSLYGTSNTLSERNSDSDSLLIFVDRYVDSLRERIGFRVEKGKDFSGEWYATGSDIGIPFTLPLVREEVDSEAGPVYFDKEILTFYPRFIEAVRNLDTAALLTMIHFPISGFNCCASLKEEHDKLRAEDFPEYVAEIFDAEGCNSCPWSNPLEIRTLIYNEEWQREEGSMLPEGTVGYLLSCSSCGEWSQEYIVAKVGESLKIVAILSAG